MNCCSSRSLAVRAVSFSAQQIRFFRHRSRTINAATIHKVNAPPASLPDCLPGVDGKDLMKDSWFNKGTAFSISERDRFGLRGLLPPRRLSMQQQIVQLIEEKKKLSEENDSLRSQIAGVQGVANERHARILEQEGELNLLREEIRILKEENTLLKIELKESKISRQKLNARVLNLNASVLNLNASVLNLNARVLKLELPVEYQKFLVAMQDINRFHQLESQVPNLYKLRKKRREISHFIDENDSLDLRNYKASFTLTKINEMSTPCQQIFGTKFSDNFLTQFTNEVKKIGLVVGSVSDDEIVDTEEWWNE
jgi:regulator of replication initiation timing